MNKKKRAERRKLLSGSILAALIMWLLVYVDTNGSFIKADHGREASDIPYINTTSVADALFEDDWMNKFDVHGKPYHKQVIDTSDFRPYRVSGYQLQDDPFSVSKVTLNQSGSGLSLKLTTPAHFTHLTFEGVLNALATGGVKDADIELISSADTTGRNALAGVLPYFVQDDRDRIRAELAHEEVGWLIHLTHHYLTDVTMPVRLNKAMAELKHGLKKYHHQAMETAVRQQLILRFQMNGLNALKEEDEKGLVDYLMRYQASEAIYDKETERLLNRIIQR